MKSLAVKRSIDHLPAGIDMSIHSIFFHDKGESVMMNEPTDLFENECLRRWLETTRIYLFADMDSLPGASVKVSHSGVGSTTGKQNARNMDIARQKAQRKRMVRRNAAKSKGRPSRAISSFASRYQAM